MNPMASSVLFFVRTKTQFLELFRVARLLKQSGQFKPVFCFENSNLPGLDDMLLKCQKEKLDVSYMMHSPQGRGDLVTQNETFIQNKLIRLFIDRLSNWAEVSPSSIHRHYSIGLVAKEQAGWLLDHYPDTVALVVGQDGIGINQALIRQAKQRQVPVVIIPYEYSTTKQQAEHRFHAKSFTTAPKLNRWIARLRPRWVYTYQGEKLLCMHGNRIVALELLGWSVPKPWSVHGGHADVLAVESKAMFDHYRREGLPKRKLVLTGTVANDDLARFMSAAEPRTPGAPLRVLCSIPPDYTTRTQCAFDDYDTLVNFWLNTLNSLPNITLSVQLHPAVPAKYKAIIANSGITIVEENITELIPNCDVFVTSVSSVIRYAIACGKPVINYDVYGFGYTDYDTVKGVKLCTTQAEFETQAIRLTQDNLYYRQVCEEQAEVAQEWGILDGRAGERIMALFQRLAGRSRRLSVVQ